jgi:hypothetical protein
MKHLGTIVMGTVTAGVLAFALWDTVRDTSEPPTCAMQHPELSMIEELRAAKQAKLELLAGPSIASPGAYLSGVTLETPLDPAIVERLPTITRPTTEAPYQVTFTEEAGIVRAVEVVVGRIDRGYTEDCRTSDDPCACDFTGDDRAACTDLELRLHSAWGAASSDDGETRVWVDPATGARARLSSCVLTFDRAS